MARESLLKEYSEVVYFVLIDGDDKYPVRLEESLSETQSLIHKG
jgi:hypothetical protein